MWTPSICFCVLLNNDALKLYRLKRDQQQKLPMNFTWAGQVNAEVVFLKKTWHCSDAALGVQSMSCLSLVHEKRGVKDNSIKVGNIIWTISGICLINFSRSSCQGWIRLLHQFLKQSRAENVIHFPLEMLIVLTPFSLLVLVLMGTECRIWPIDILFF